MAAETTTALTAPQPIDRGMMPLAEVVGRVRRIQEVMSALMKDGIHYGTIPGTPKPTLYQPGAELLCLTFHVGPEPRVEDLSTNDTVRYRVTMRGVLQTTGEMLGEGVGECSSDETKYRWCKPVCDEEFNETPEDRRREKWMRGKNGNYRAKQIRLSPADIANTILKMAFKRALISMTRVTLACSDIFAQDLEDLPPDVREAVLDAENQEQAVPKKEPQRASASNGGAKPTNGQPKPAAPTPEVPSELSAPTTIQSVSERKGPNGPIWYINTAKQEYSCFEMALAAQLESFVGTDHRVVLRFVSKTKGEKTYRNVVSFAVAEATETPAPAHADASPSQDEMRWE